ncbi:hypothetical protein AB0J20_24760 [Micromonospora costi]|uniref:hypothetical protein n=1 Tax=Micromonospora costi TaxID=1530042 RepID=UPI0033CFDB77
MRDDLTFAEQVQRDLRDVHWPGPEEIRALARRRSRRRIVAATAVLALAGISAAAVAVPGGSSPPPAASASPTASPRAEITREALLQPADLAQPVDVELYESGLGEMVNLSSMLGYCREDQGLPVGWVESRLSRSQTMLREGRAGADSRPADVVATQGLYRLAPDEANAFFSELDALVAPCARWRSVGPYELKGRSGTAEAVHSWQVVRRGFAGDEAVVLRHTVSRPRDLKTGETVGDEIRPTDTAVVRVGDLIAVLNLNEATEAELMQLSVVAAARMCASANPGC